MNDAEFVIDKICEMVNEYTNNFFNNYMLKNLNLDQTILKTILVGFSMFICESQIRPISEFIGKEKVNEVIKIFKDNFDLNINITID